MLHCFREVADYGGSQDRLRNKSWRLLCWCQKKMAQLKVGPVQMRRIWAYNSYDENTNFELLTILKSDVYKNCFILKSVFISWPRRPHFLSDSGISRSANIIWNNSKRVRFQRIKFKCSSPGISIFILIEECKES